jgi:hypothetical protein
MQGDAGGVVFLRGVPRGNLCLQAHPTRTASIEEDAKECRCDSAATNDSAVNEACVPGSTIVSQPPLLLPAAPVAASAP